MILLIKHILKHYWKILSLIIFLTYVEINFDVAILIYLSLTYKAITYHEIAIELEILSNIYVYIAILVIASLMLAVCYIYLMSRFTYNIRNKMFEIISDLDKIEDYNKIKHISVFSRIVSNVTVEQNFLIFLMKKMIFIIIFAIYLLNDVILYNTEIISFLTVSSIIITAFLLFGIKRVTKDYFKVHHQQLYTNSLFSDAVKKFRLIRYFSNEKYHNKKYNNEIQNAFDLNIKFVNRLKFSLVASILVDISFCALVYLLVVMFKNGTFDVFRVLVIMQVMTIIMAYTDALFNLTFNYNPVHVRSLEISEILHLEKSSNRDAFEIEENISQIEFKDVSLKIDEKEILNNISFKIDSNTKTLILGSVASGKTSLAYLLTKFHDATNGKILINGKNIDHISTDNLRKKIIYVPTESFVFTDTLLENIRLGDESKTKDDVLRVCEETLLSEYDIDLNEKLYEKESGVTADFRQRLALARALLHEYDVYIFDNSFSLINGESKKVILKNIKEKLENKTIIFLENSYEKTYDVDNVIFLDNTRIINQENNKNLLESYDFEKNSSIVKEGANNGI